MIVQDFSFTSPEELMANIDHSAGHGGMGHDMGDRGTMQGMSGMEKDLNDIDFDAYLANDRTLADPEVVIAFGGAAGDGALFHRVGD
jgi:hypothetical protein